MADIEKIKQGVKACWSEHWCHKCFNCPYKPDRDNDNACVERLGANVLELLKEQQQKKGEWIITGRKNIYGSIEIKCPCCSDTVMVQHIEDELFCRHCGADMRNGGEQE